jgi:hypothetical protein
MRDGGAEIYTFYKIGLSDGIVKANYDEFRST